MTAWPTVELGEICDLVGGGTPKKSRPEFYGGSILWATVRDLNTDCIVSTEHTVTPAGLASSSAKVIPKGTVVIAARVGLGKVAVLGEEAALNQDLRGLVVREKSQVLPGYLYWWYRSVASRVVAAGTGATVQGVTLPFLRSLPVPLPPVAEQMRISNHLDHAQSLVDSLLSNLAAGSGLTRQFRNRLTELQASEIDATRVVRLGDVLSVQNGFAFSSKNFSANGEVGLIRIRDLKNGEGTQTRFSGEYSPDYLVRAGDLLIGMDGEFRCYQWRGEPALLNQRVCRLIDFAEDVVPEYLLFVLNEHLKQIEDVTGYATVKHLSSKTIKAIELPLPSIDDQKRAVKKWSGALEQIHQLEESFDRQVQLAQSLRAEVIRSAIWGGA